MNGNYIKTGFSPEKIQNRVIRHRIEIAEQVYMQYSVRVRLYVMDRYIIDACDLKGHVLEYHALHWF